MKIKGSISQLLKETGAGRVPFIGLPINDSNGNKIGSITEVNIDNDTWYGEISENVFEEVRNDNQKGFSIEAQGRANKTSKK